MVWGAAILDMDGVVVDTVPIHFKAWKRMAEDYGRPFTFEDYKAKVDGIPRIDGASAILQGFDRQTIEDAAERKQGYFRALLSDEEIPVYQSTIDFIDLVRARQIRVAVISSSKNAPFILERIGLLDRLDAVVDGHGITRGKPDPEIFLIAARRLERRPNACIVFEDAVLGVTAAKRAGMICIGIDRYGDPRRLAEADRVIRDIDEISCEALEDLMK
jgi:beta-phosphoglucomutase